MSLHTRGPQRLASISARRTVGQWQSARYYASATANDPEWFQQVRAELLRRKPQQYREVLDTLHHKQLDATVAGFQTRGPREDTLPDQVALAHVLTRFNAREPLSTLLPDGTDPLHSPGEPWVRRMWAGGAVKIKPDLDPQAKSPFRLFSRVACVEHIKDVRLQGSGDEAKIFVTIERRFALERKVKDAARSQAESGVDEEWGDALLKEERNLVFLKPKTAAELKAIKGGETLVPRYLKCTRVPRFRSSLTRSSTVRPGCLTRLDANTCAPLSILGAYVQRPPTPPRSRIRPDCRRPPQPACAWAAHAHADASAAGPASRQGTERPPVREDRVD
ncbi:hypothetical protein OPT61_g9677 [Boeremia exigua]|uniref:Uncharacterized protein n=1 Tax=Boeremia exigua TaxID=749465 RepID=A0ACC2HTW3_9PLEO|nr:hypothetical protein OPT61_g9677 [Boeremia exigua]